MPRANVHQGNAVWEKIDSTAKTEPSANQLRNHVGAIADELASQDKFDWVGGVWVLSWANWDAWMRTRADGYINKT